MTQAAKYSKCQPRCMVFFFSSGWIVKSAILLLIGNTYVYLYDRWRSVRYIAAFKYSSNQVDDMAQSLMGVPCGILAGALMYHLRLMRVFGLGDDVTIILVITAIAVHVNRLVYLTWVGVWGGPGLIVCPTLEGPFSAVSKPIYATKGSFCSVA